MKIHFNSIKLKQTVFYTVFLLLLLFIFHFIAYMLLTSGLYNNLSDSLLSDSERAKEVIFNSGTDDITSLLNELKGDLDNQVFIYNVISKVITGDVNISDEVKTKLSSMTYVSGASFSYPMETSNGRILLYVTSLELATEPGSLLCLTRDAYYIHSIIDSYKRMLYGAVPIIIVLALISGFIISSYFLRQVNAITRTADKIDPTNLISRIPVKSADELGRLSMKLNSLFNQIYGFINRQRQFTADASHDLRAPLTNIKAETTLALRKPRSTQEYKEVLKRIDRETEHLNTMVDDLLTLASMDTQPERARTLTIDLSGYIEGILDVWETQYAEKGVKLVSRITPDIEIRGDLLHFNQILDNLLKNALEYTPAGGEVSCSLEIRDKDIVIIVSDTGIGISEKDLPHVFDRFYKVDRDTPGNGLGLPIVEGTVKMYGGTVTAASELGKGSVFKVVMPAKQPYYITFD
ncbi:MAG: HAMP domain-containing sensor histidine kinase [Dehalococcoidales bacterium]|nr:HAMP domain-containing sensor histidine kinase [Dehalococcoidales bacterium]